MSNWSPSNEIYIYILGIWGFCGGWRYLPSRVRVLGAFRSSSSLEIEHSSSGILHGLRKTKIQNFPLFLSVLLRSLPHERRRLLFVLRTETNFSCDISRMRCRTLVDSACVVSSLAIETGLFRFETSWFSFRNCLSKFILFLTQNLCCGFDFEYDKN